MPLMHCMDCHHEWESTSDQSLCDWCGAAGYVLDPLTSLEKMIRDKRALKKLINDDKELRWHERSYVEKPAFKVNENERP